MHACMDECMHDHACMHLPMYVYIYIYMFIHIHSTMKLLNIHKCSTCAGVVALCNPAGHPKLHVDAT